MKVLRWAASALLSLLGAAQALAAEKILQPWGDGMLLLRDAISMQDLAQVLKGERAAWADPFLTERELVNQTRRITGSPALQSVTWLHRQRAEAGGAIERVEAAAVAAQRAAGWALGPPLHTRCVESIRYEIASSNPAVEEGGGERMGGGGDGSASDGGWHQDEWSILTAVLTIGASSDLQGGEVEVDRGAGPRRAVGLGPGDLLLFRSWDAHRSTPVMRGNRHILVIELWQVRPPFAIARTVPPRGR
jgi:hypothetical protein